MRLRVDGGNLLGRTGHGTRGGSYGAGAWHMTVGVDIWQLVLRLDEPSQCQVSTKVTGTCSDGGYTNFTYDEFLKFSTLHKDFEYTVKYISHSQPGKTLSLQMVHTWITRKIFFASVIHKWETHWFSERSSLVVVLLWHKSWNSRSSANRSNRLVLSLVVRSVYF